MAQIAAGSYLGSQKLYDTSVTLFTESQTIVAHLYRQTTEDGDDDGIICVEDRQDVKDMGGGRGSNVTFYYGDRRRGQDIAPRALGSTGFGQSAPQRPIYSQTLNMQAQELATTGFFALEIGQTYGNVPLEKKELRDCGAEAAELICRSIYYHLSGLTAYNSTGSLWPVSPCGNLVTEVDAKHRFWVNGKTSDANVAADSASILTMEYLEQVITYLQDRSTGVNSPMVPGMTPWGEWFLFICCSQGAEQLTRHSSTNRFTSLTIAEIQGGNDIDKVASFMRANSGMQGTRRILVLIDDYTPFGMSGSTSGATTAGTQIGNCRRGMLLGRAAMKLIWGQGFDAESSHIRATNHTVHLQQDWKFMTHWGGVSMIPTDAPTPQRMGSATVTYYVTGTTPTV